MKNFSLAFICLLFNNIVVCQNKQTPIIFVHGMLASGDTWTKHIQMFEEKGYPENYLHVMDWNTMLFNQNIHVKQLDSIINFVKLKTNSKQVNLVGHSAGGGICTKYISDTSKSNNIINYVHLASSELKNPLNVKTLNLYSSYDQITGGKNVEYAKNINIEDKDHYEIATCKESFEAIYNFFNQNNQPDNPNSLSDQKLSGKLVTLGENFPEKNCLISIYEYNPLNGERISNSAVESFTSNNQGYWGPFIFEKDKYYEFVIQPKNKRTIHYFRQPFRKNSNLIYFRTLPNNGLAASLLSALPVDKKQVSLAIFSSNKAIISGRDSLFVNDIELSSELISPAKKTAIAYFIFDENNDEKSSLNPIPSFQMFPFLNGVDTYLNSKPKNLITVKYNGKTITLKPIPSNQGLMVLVID